MFRKQTDTISEVRAMVRVREVVQSAYRVPWFLGADVGDAGRLRVYVRDKPFSGCSPGDKASPAAPDAVAVFLGLGLRVDDRAEVVRL
jgi:hypothetical protein